MKKIISILLIFCLLLSVCGCKRKDPEDTAASLDISKQTPEKEESSENTETEKESTAENDITDLQWDSVYSEYEILVTLTEDESMSDKSYTVSDFRYIELNYVYKLGNYTDYFVKNTVTEEKYKNKTTLVLFLKEGGGEKILNAIKELEKDSRIFIAQPCALELGKGFNGEIEVFAQTQYEVPEWFTYNFLKDLENPPEYSLSFSKHIVEGSRSVFINVASDNVCDVISIANHLHKKSAKIKIKFKYKIFGDSFVVCLTENQSNLKSEYRSEDFKNLNLIEVQKLHTRITDGKKQIFLRLFPENTEPFFMKKYEQTLNEDVRVENSFAASEGFCEILNDIKKAGYDVSKDDESVTSSITTDEDFYGGLIILYMKKGYSSIHHNYTPDDFPYLELNSVKMVFEYEGDNRVGIFLHLKKSDKQSVISAIEKLKYDERVYLACPNYKYEVVLD